MKHLFSIKTVVPVLITLWLAFSAAEVALGGETVAFREKYDLANGPFRGSATLSIENPVVPKAGLLPLEIRFLTTMAEVISSIRFSTG